MKRPLHLLAALAATAIAPASSDWTYLEPMYACSPRNSNAPAGNCNLNTHSCLANPNHPQATDDAACAACASDQTYWPCDVDGLCYCWEEGTSKIPPAPSTRIYNGGEGLNVSSIDPCDIVTEEIFKTMAPMAMAPYSYEGFCTAVHKYNENHPDEGVFNMGTLEQQKAELAAFFGNVLHESDDMKAGREYLMCADRVEMGGETYCKPCDVSSFDWDTMTCPGGASLASEGRAFNNYCQSNLLPPEGCECDDVYERAEQGPMAGYVKSDDVYFGRGAIQLSWNYNYIKASVALTGAPQTFCQRPDLVATTPEYAIGAGLFFWMENVKNDRTCHQGVLLEEDFGKTLDTINGGLECPADSHGWHGKAVQLRLNRYCRAASAIGVERLLSLDGCMGMDKRMTQCLDAGTCPDCRDWEESYLAAQASREGGAEDAVEVAVVESQGGGKKKDKNPNKQNGNGGGGGGGRAKALKQQEVAASEEPAAAEEEAAAVDDGKFDQKKAKEMQKLKKEAAARGMTLEELAKEKGMELDYSLLATERPTPEVQEEVEEPTQEEEEPPKAAEEPPQEEEEPPKAESPTPPTPPIQSASSEEAACTGEPCHIPQGRASDRLEFCRAANRICGMGPAYCNERSVWSAECPAAAGDGASEGGHDVATSASFASAGTDTEEDAGAVVSAPKETRPPTPPRITRSPTPPQPQSAGASVSSSASKFGATPAGHGKGKSDGMPAISSAGQFGSGGKPAPKPPSSPAKSEPAPAKPKAPAGPPSAMAFMTHAKGRNIPVDVEEGMENAHAAPSASQFGGMTNWANTKLEHPPTLSPVAAPGKGDAGAMADAHYVVVPTPTPPPTRLPTKLPTERPVKVINIADAFSTFSSLEDEPEDEVGEEDKEEEAIGMRSVGSDAAVAEEVPMLQSAKSETAKEPNASPESYYSRTSPSSYEFSPLDDVTLSRTYSDQNFGASPSIVVDMLEGDAALLRFDLSIIGDGTIEKAVLRLTPKEEDGTTSGGVYYIQPVVNGWTEDGVTYATSPKADGSLFASVASRSDDGKYELDVTKAAANHVISFRVVGTDRVRSEFSSKEAADSNRAPVLIVALESKEAPMIETPKAELNEADSSASEMLSSAKGQGSGGKGELSSAKRPDTNELDASSSSAASLEEAGAQSPSGGRIFGHIWLDRNADGLQDSTEPGLRGILVDLYECDGDLWLEGTRTAAGGDFIFEDLHEGSYYVDVTAGADLGFSAKGAATERSVRDSDVDQATGRSDCIELSSSSGLSVSVNAGIVKPTPGASPSTATAEALVTPATSSTSVSVPKIDEDSPDYNCRGRPCTEGPEYCRSKHNSCGTGDEYCNEDSQWTSECGTPSPTLKPTGAPTTGLPTFVHDPDAHCAGDPCIKGEEGDGTWCRSEIGYCGSGPLYCNSASLWVPECDAASAGGSSSLKDVAASFAAGEVDVSSIISNSTSDDEEDIPTETPTYFPTKGDEEFSSFVLPTLSHIVTPKQTDISALKKGHGSGSTNSVESDGDASLSTDTASSEPGSDDDEDQSSTKENQAPNTGENSVENEPWYIRYSNLEPVSRSAGLRLSTSAAAFFCAAMAALRLL